MKRSMKKTHGLGRGLDSLLPGTDDPELTIQELDIDLIDPNPEQPRRTFSKESISQLAQSIRDQGVLQPLLVVPRNGGRYRIIAGERRYRASREAGLKTVPCVIRDMDVIQQMEVALIENLQREDLNPIDAAQGIKTLMQHCGYTQDKVALRLGKSRPTVANLLRLLTLPSEVAEMVRDGRLSAGHARVLAGLGKDTDKIALAKRTMDEDLSVRELEQIAAVQKKTTVRKPAGKKQLAPELRELQNRLLEKTGMKTTMTGTASKGKIILTYSTRDELETLYELLNQ